MCRICKYLYHNQSLTGNILCGSGTGQLTWTATSGTGPFTVIYNPGNVTVTGVTSGTPFSVGTVSTTTPYTLFSVAGAYCTRSSGFTGGTGTVTVISSSDPLIWDGSESHDWNTADNWTPAFIPTTCTSISIPVVSRFPTLTSSGSCYNISIASGASFVVTASGSLTMAGTATVPGKYRSVPGIGISFPPPSKTSPSGMLLLLLLMLCIG